MDGDLVSKDPLDRQWIYTHDDIGKPKVSVLSEWILQRKSEIEVHAIANHFENEIPFLPDLIFDFTDRLASKQSIMRYCLKNKIPLIHAASQRNHGAIALLLPNSSLYNYLLSEKFNDASSEVSCHDGVTTSVVGTVGMQAAHLAWMYVEGLPITSDYAIFDGLTNQWEKFNFDTKENSSELKDILISNPIQLLQLKEKFNAQVIHLGEHPVFPYCQPDELKNKLMEVSNAIILCKNGFEACSAATYFSNKFQDKRIFAFAGSADSLLPTFN